MPKEKPKRSKKDPLSEEVVIDDDTTANEEEGVKRSEAAEFPAQDKSVTRAPRKKSRKSAAIITESDDETTDGGDNIVNSKAAHEVQQVKSKDTIKHSSAQSQVDGGDETEIDENTPLSVGAVHKEQGKVSTIDFAAQPQLLSNLIMRLAAVCQSHLRNDPIGRSALRQQQRSHVEST